MQERDIDFIRDEEEIDRLLSNPKTCDECGSTGRCHPNCSFVNDKEE